MRAEVTADHRWVELPLVGAPLSFAGPDTSALAVDAERNEVVTLDHRPGTKAARPLTFEAQSVVTDPDPEAVRAAPADEAEIRTARALLHGTSVEPELDAILARTDAHAPVLDRLQDAAVALTGGAGLYRDDAPSGHSLGRLARFLEGETEARPGPGTSEQAATLLALAARLLGRPSRVVVGFALSPRASSGGPPVEVRAHSVRAWTEVEFGSAEWVAFDPAEPTGEARPADGDLGAAPAPPPREERGSGPSAADDVPATTILPADPSSAGPGARPPTYPRRADDEPCTEPAGCVPVPDGPLVRWWLLPVVAVALSIAALGWAARRRRRRPASPTVRVARAWRGVALELRDHGCPVAEGLTVAELAQASREHFGTAVSTEVERLAPVVDVALYGADEPGPDLARQAEEAHTAVRVALRADAVNG
jgi:hypothetical protein